MPAIPGLPPIPQHVPLSWYLILSAILFGLGICGFMFRKNLITVFMSIELMLNAVNLSANVNITGSRQVVTNARGRLKSTPPPATTPPTPVCFPIFSTESATATPTNDSVSINVEIINGTTVNNLLSSSSFNYTISPRR